MCVLQVMEKLVNVIYNKQKLPTTQIVMDLGRALLIRCNPKNPPDTQLVETLLVCII